MGGLSGEGAVERLKWRYAVKAFDPAKKIPAEVWGALEETLVLTPSSFGLQPWKFFVVEDAAVRESLVAHAWGQRQVAEASHLVVMAIRSPMTMEDVDRHLARMSAVRSTPVAAFEGLRKMIAGFMASPGFSGDEWAARQVYIALGQFMATAAMLGVDTCPMEGFVPAKFDEALGLRELGYKSCVVVTAGYRAADDKYAALPKVRFEKGEVVGYVQGQ
jgi:nitroreductase